MANSTPKKKKDKLPALIKSKRGNISAVARAMKVDRHTVYSQIEADESLKQLLANAREEMLDNAEDKLGSAIKKGEAWAVCFTLKTQGKVRGYVEKQEIDHGGSLNLNHSGEIAFTEAAKKIYDSDRANNKS